MFIKNIKRFNSIKDKLIDITMSCDKCETLNILRSIWKEEAAEVHPDIHILLACEELGTEIQNIKCLYKSYLVKGAIEY